MASRHASNATRSSASKYQAGPSTTKRGKRPLNPFFQQPLIPGNSFQSDQTEPALQTLLVLAANSSGESSGISQTSTSTAASLRATLP
jgi:hypothetical protein